MLAALILNTRGTRRHPSKIPSTDRLSVHGTFEWFSLKKIGEGGGGRWVRGQETALTICSEWRGTHYTYTHLVYYYYYYLVAKAV